MPSPSRRPPAAAELIALDRFAQSGVTTLESGEPTPSDPDGTAAFPALSGGGSVLVSNHEVGGDEPFGVLQVGGFVYDDQARGGTTTIETDADRGRVREYSAWPGRTTTAPAASRRGTPG